MISRLLEQYPVHRRGRLLGDFVDAWGMKTRAVSDDDEQDMQYFEPPNLAVESKYQRTRSDC